MDWEVVVAAASAALARMREARRQVIIASGKSDDAALAEAARAGVEEITKLAVLAGAAAIRPAEILKEQEARSLIFAAFDDAASSYDVIIEFRELGIIDPRRPDRTPVH